MDGGGGGELALGDGRGEAKVAVAAAEPETVVVLEDEMERMLERGVSASTQNQAFSALMYFYGKILRRPLESEHVPSEAKTKLRARRDDLDPFELHDRLEEGLKRVLHLALNSSRPTASLHCGSNGTILEQGSVS